MRITFDRTARHEDKRKAEQISRRFETLLLMQLDVRPGELPRTAQKMVATERLSVVNGGGGRVVYVGACAPAKSWL